MIGTPPQINLHPCPGQVVPRGSDPVDVVSSTSHNSQHSKDDKTKADEENLVTEEDVIFGNLQRCTTSVRDRLEKGPTIIETTWRGRFCVHLKRTQITDISVVGLLTFEHEQLSKKRKVGTISSQYMAWRSSLLHCGVIFFGAQVAMDILVIVDPWGTRGSSSLFMSRVQPRYRDFFSDFFLYHQLHQAGLLTSSCLAVVFACVAAWFWTRYQVSRLAMIASFLCSYFPPFLLGFIPFRKSVDFTGIQQQVCKDILTAPTEYVANSTLANSTLAIPTLWPQFIGDLARNIYQAFDITVPRNFCSRDPKQWPDIISNLLDDGGFLPDEKTKTCPREEQTLGRLVNSSLANSSPGLLVSSSLANRSDPLQVFNIGCPSPCWNCSQGCRMYLPLLSALSAGFGDATAKAVQTLGPGALSCWHCLSSDPALRCVANCPSVMVALAEETLHARTPLRPQACIKPEQLQDLDLLMRLATMTAYWETVLGGICGILLLTQILPLSLSLLLGASKGSGIAKSVVPYSRLPNVISSAAAIFTFPFVLQVAILFQSVIGSLITFFAIILMLFALIFAMKPDVLRIYSYEEMRNRQKRLGIGSMIAILASLILFIVEAGTSDLVHTLSSHIRAQGMTLSQQDYQKLRSSFTWTVVSLVMTLLGQSVISTVFFADAVVTLMYRFHYNEQHDDLKVRANRVTLVADLHTMFPPDNSCCGLSEVQDIDVDKEDDELTEKWMEALRTISESPAPGGTADQNPAERDEATRRMLARWMAKRVGHVPMENSNISNPRIDPSKPITSGNVQPASQK